MPSSELFRMKRQYNYVCQSLVLLIGAFHFTQAGAVLKLRMKNFDNPKALTLSGSSCADGECKQVFTFCLDKSTGNDDAASCYFKTWTTGIFNGNSIAFGSDMRGVVNPLENIFHPWPGAIKFKVRIGQEQEIDEYSILFYGKLQKTWTSLQNYGDRSTDPTKLTYEYRLICESYYFGDSCEVYCQKRNDSQGHFACHPSNGAKLCHGGWEDPATNCTKSIDDCVGVVCENGGTCIDGHQQAACVCPLGYTGEWCSVDIDECVSLPCQNNASCSDGSNYYTCNCLPGFTGEHCEFEIDECASEPCQHNSTCWDDVDRYSCGCVPGYAGSMCEIEVDECASEPCQNDATCCDEVNSYTCVCSPGFTDMTCESDIDECASQPCQNGGVCTDDNSSYSCECLPQYIGDQCQHHICTVQSPCLNGGTCYGSGSCYCSSGFTGSDCSIHLCDVRRCKNNGTCDEDTGVCWCQDGYVGDSCDVHLCSLISCDNGGICVNGSCLCPPYFTGRHCHRIIDGCSSSPCQNNASCRNALGGFACVCPSGFSGIICEGRSNNSEEFVPTTALIFSSNGEGVFPVWAVAVLAAMLLLSILAAAIITVKRRGSYKADLVGGGNGGEVETFDNPVYTTDESMFTSENTSALTRPPPAIDNHYFTMGAMSSPSGQTADRKVDVYADLDLINENPHVLPTSVITRNGSDGSTAPTLANSCPGESIETSISPYANLSEVEARGAQGPPVPPRLVADKTSVVPWYATYPK